MRAHGALYPQPQHVTHFKICCIADAAELALAVTAGANAVGLVGPMPSGPGPIPLARIRELAPLAPPAVQTFFLTSQTTVDGILGEHDVAGTTTIQLVDHVGREALRALRQARPQVKLVQVIHVRDAASVADALAAAPFVDALLLDSGNPNAAVKELGGTGRVHDWALSARICADSGVPVYLAGGLNAGNVTQAIASVRPYGVDVCSGVRTGGVLDAQKLSAFATAVKAAPSA